nr:PREDICTED: inactive ubiquitin carboxyl-terminal hydrolase 50 isoform X1 [Latimeria chalumnae]|eukprot:XP_005989707.2 PREDICTED: inactive ubiquitin carboxyl-terminal hydrolase 50 isoform X1 [Latimeria chalumnae]
MAQTDFVDPENEEHPLRYLSSECRALEYSSNVSKDSRYRHVPRLTGLYNSGNSCYMNAVLQCLCSTTPLVEYFLSGKYQEDLGRSKGEVSCAFGQLVTDMWLGEYKCIYPAQIRAVIGNLHHPFANRAQQDAQELLVYLLNGLHDELKRSTRRRFPMETTFRSGQRKLSLPCTELSIITHLFEGQLDQVTVCLKCHNTVRTNEAFTVLSLPIPSGRKCSLQDCLECFFQQDTLTWNDQMLCSLCEKKQDTSVKANIAKLPDFVLLHLKRFDYCGQQKRKLRTEVSFPLENLDFSPYAPGPFGSQGKYNLYAVVNHSGDMDSGHYTAYCKHPVTHNWFEFDDETVNYISASTLQSSAAYIFFYTCQELQVPCW